MLGLVLFGLMEHEFSVKFLQNALTLATKHHGSTSLKCAHWWVTLSSSLIISVGASYPSFSLLCSYHLLSMVYESKRQLRLALQHEKEAHLIYSKLVSLKVQPRWCLCVHRLASANFNLHTQAGEDCDRTEESWKHLQSLMQQQQQQTINQGHSLTPDVCASLLEVCTPLLFQQQPDVLLM